MGKVSEAKAEKKFKVLITDSIDFKGVEILQSIAQVDIRTNLNEDEICNIIPQYHALMVRSGTRVTSRIIKSGSNLLIIGRAGVGVDNVDVQTATEHAIFVVNSPMGNTVAAAEHAICLMFALSRHICDADRSLRDLKWERSKFMGTELQFKTLGIVGLGQVGRHVARICREIGMHLLCYDPFVNEQKALSLGCKKCTFEELLQNSDFVTMHIPLTNETRHMINKKTLSIMKKTAKLINTSRGGIVNEGDLAEALQNGQLGGAALDVFEVEKAFPADSPLLNAPNLIITPHLGASTVEAQENVAVDVAHQIKDTLLGNLPTSAVNIPGIRISEVQHLRTLLNCCETLGFLAAQLLNEAAICVCVTLEGAYADEKGEPLLLAVANGVLSKYSERRVNFINAKEVAESHKIQLKVSKAYAARASVKVELKSENESTIVQGFVNDDETLLTSFDGFPIYMPLIENSRGNSTYTFYSKHYDTPGVLAEITTKLAEAKVNIANCHLGRKVVDGTKLGCCIFSIDEPIDNELMNNIRKGVNVIECKVCLSG